MRAMVLRPGPSFSVSDVCRGWVAALRMSGVDVVDLNYDDRLSFYAAALRHEDVAPGCSDLTEDQLFAALLHLMAHDVRADLYDFWPDVVIVISGFFVPALFYEIVRDRGHKIVLVCTESPYEDDRQLQRAPYADLVILNDPTNLEQFREINPNTHYFPHCYDPAIHYPAPPSPELASDFAFVGTGYPSRIEFLEQIDWSGLDVCLGGNWQKVADESVLFPFLMHDRGLCLDNEDAVDVYRSTKVSANLYRKEATQAALVDGWAMGPREVELAATGTFFLREPRGEGDEVFPFLPTFTGPGEFSELLRHYVAHDDEREGLIEKARAAVAERTFQRNAQRLLELL